MREREREREGACYGWRLQFAFQKPQLEGGRLRWSLIARGWCRAILLGVEWLGNVGRATVLSKWSVILSGWSHFPIPPPSTLSLVNTTLYTYMNIYSQFASSIFIYPSTFDRLSSIYYLMNVLTLYREYSPTHQHSWCMRYLERRRMLIVIEAFPVSTCFFFF